jgi:hypothetical protein
MSILLLGNANKMSPRISGFLDFVRRPQFQIPDKTALRKLDFPAPNKEWETATVLGPLKRANLNHWVLAVSKGSSNIGGSLSSPEDGKRSSFRNVVLSGV